MKLIASVHAATDLNRAVAGLAAAVGITPAEARLRLIPEPPLLLASVPAERVEPLLSDLRRAGLTVFALDAAVPSDAGRTVVRTVELGPTAALFQSRTGPDVSLSWAQVGALLRGTSLVRSESETVHTSKKGSLALAIASQGMKMSRTVERTERSQQDETEQVLFVYGWKGERLVLREHEVNFACLGPAMQPTRLANMVTLARLFKERAREAFYDERLLRLGRRPLPPFLGSGESLAQTGKTAQKRLDTSRGLDVLAEVLWRSVVTPP